MAEQNGPGAERAKHPRSRRASAVIVALVLIVLLGFAAIAVDVGAMYVAQSQLQAGVDAGALGGAARLDRTRAGVGEAVRTAQEVSGLNEAWGQPIVVSSGDVVPGRWDPATGSFVVVEEAEQINALRVTARIEDLPTPFAGVAFGRPFADIGATTVAARGPSQPPATIPCFLPVAIPRCRYDDLVGGPPPHVHGYQLANDSEDDIGWAFPGSASAATVNDALERTASGACADDDDAFVVGETIDLVNGVQASNLHTLRALLLSSTEPWDADLWGPKPPADDHSDLDHHDYPSLGVLQGPVAVFDEGGQLCSSVTFNQSRPVDRYVWGVIFDVYTGPGSHMGLQMLIDPEHPFEVPGSGSGNGGNVVSPPPPRLVLVE